MLTLVGVLLILGAIIVTAWWVMGEHQHKGWALTIWLGVIFVGAFFVLQERVTELTVQGIGTIRSAAEKANADATAISDLKKRVEAQSATVDLVAKDAADAKQLVSDLSEKNSKAEEKLSQIDRSIKEGDAAVRQLKLYTQFNSTVLAAQDDDRRAFDQLRAWSVDDSFPFQKPAAQAYQTVVEQHDPTWYSSGIKISRTDGLDLNKLSLVELNEEFRNAPADIRVGLVEFVWKRTDLSKRDRLRFLVDVLRSDESLRVVEYAGRYFAEGTGNKSKPIDINKHVHWWDENGTTIK